LRIRWFRVSVISVVVRIAPVESNAAEEPAAVKPVIMEAAAMTPAKARAKAARVEPATVGTTATSAMEHAASAMWRCLGKI
jgi:hypothetical protein